jgi:hypothetical protein
MSWKVLVLSLVVGAETASAAVIQVNDAKGERKFAQAVCLSIQAQLVIERGGQVPLECRMAPGTGGADYEVARDAHGRVSFRALDPEVPAGWEVLDDPETLIPRLVARHEQARRKKRVVQEAALAMGVHAGESRAVVLGKDGRYLDPKTRAELSFQEAFRRFENEGPRQRHYLRATIELTAILGIGWLNYILDDVNRLDYDHSVSWHTLRSKLTFDYWALDTNKYDTNALAHPFSGAVYYWFSRANGLGSLEALLMSIAASTFWEFVGEFQEKVSINDMVVTPVAGMAIGEVLHQLGDFFASSSGHWLHEVFAGIFGMPQRAHDWLDKAKRVRAGRYDEFGFPADRWHRFELFTSIQGPLKGQGPAAAGGGFDLEVANIPVYGQEEKGVRLLRNTAFSRLAMSLAGNAEGMQDLTFYTQAALAGYYAQDVRRDEGGKLRGWTFFVGPSVGFEYKLENRALGDGTRFDDKIGVVHVLGSTMDVTYRASGLLVRLTLDVHGDWAAVRSFGLEPNTSQPLSNVLRNEGYNHQLGASMRSRLRASYRDFEAGIEAELGRYFSIQAWEREGEPGTATVDGSGRARFWVGYRIGGGRIQVRLAIEYRNRSGSVGHEFRNFDELLGLGQIVFIF